MDTSGASTLLAKKRHQAVRVTNIQKWGEDRLSICSIQLADLGDHTQSDTEPSYVNENMING